MKIAGGFKLTDLAKLDMLDTVILEASKESAKRGIAESAAKKLNVVSGNLSNPKNWDAKVVNGVLVVTSSKSIPYAGIQNDGGKIRITDKMRAKMWALYAETGNEMFKFIALTKKAYVEIKATNYADIKLTLDTAALSKIQLFLMSI